jgi:phage baseplate assembly protein V
VSDLAYRVTELERRVANQVLVATVEALDEAAARVRVRAGALVTGWLPWLTRRAGPDADWWAPEPGEQVVLLSPGGEPEQGVVLPALYQSAYPAPANDRRYRRSQVSDAAFVQYDRATGALTAEGKGDATLTAAGKVSLTGKGTVEVRGAAAAPVKGVVQGDCLCPFTRQFHLHISADVKASKG